MVDILYKFLPMTSPSKNTTTFETIFSESNIANYLKGDYKKDRLLNGWTEVIRRHPKLPFTLIRKIVPTAIDYRKAKRNPLTQNELNNLLKALNDLDIDMNEELKGITIDETLPEIQIPPQQLLLRLEQHNLTKEVYTDPLQLFRDGHYNEAVRKASERFEKYVQDKSGLSEIGKTLMSKTFNINNPVIKLNSLSSQNEKGIQEGYQFMTMGLMLGIRNIFSHGDESQRSPEECFEMLLFINWLFRQI